MISCLPRVTRLLLIGWRASEAHFLQLLRDGLPKTGPFVKVVCENSDAATRAAGNLKDAGIECPSVTRNGDGFSGFVANRQLEQWLSRVSP